MNPNAPICGGIPKDENVNPIYAFGLTIRDYIAIEAMKAVMHRTNQNIKSTLESANALGIKVEQAVSEIAYIYADALIAQSNK